jgi:hypothetical protein
MRTHPSLSHTLSHYIISSILYSNTLISLVYLHTSHFSFNTNFFLNFYRSRCLGADFLPFLPMVITKLLAAISQEVSFQAGGVDLEELEQR